MKSHLLLAAVLGGAVALSGCNRDGGMDTTAEPAGTATDALETPPDMADDTPAEAAAVTITEVYLGTAVDESEAVIEPRNAFASDDEVIHVAITTVADAGDAPATATVGVRWTFEDGQLIDERSTALEFSGQDTTSFYIENTEGWPMGTYDVEVTLNGETAETRQFTVQ